MGCGGHRGEGRGRREGVMAWEGEGDGGTERGRRERGRERYPNGSVGLNKRCEIRIYH